ncbi:peptide-methionine (S)-S-oxide reductase, partial [Pseudomonas aeruginosa]
NDVGTQYRSAIFTTDAQQATVARALVEEMQSEKAFDAPMVTQIEPLTNYWPAEDYHQDYFLQHPGQGYCAFVVGPKVQKF